MKDGDILCLEKYPASIKRKEKKRSGLLVAELATARRYLGQRRVSSAGRNRRARLHRGGLGHVLPALCRARHWQGLNSMRFQQGCWMRPTRPVIAHHRRCQGLPPRSNSLENLVGKVRLALVIGGGHGQYVSCTRRGVPVGKVAGGERSGGDPPLRNLSRRRKAANCAIILPVDAVVAFSTSRPMRRPHGLWASMRISRPTAMILGRRGRQVDRGAFMAAIDDAATLVWNGPARRVRAAAVSTAARCWAARLRGPARTKAGQADLGRRRAATRWPALNQAGVAGDFTYVSTAGRRVSRMDGRETIARCRGFLKKETLDRA